MTKSIDIPLQSYQLAKYAVQVPCYICGEGNAFDGEFCRHCFAPMALAHQANTQDVRPAMIATLGASGVGKTVYLGMLMDMLSRETDERRLQMLARGAFSINLQQITASALARCEFPDKTPNEPDRWNWVHCQVRDPKRKQPVELVMPDMAGEAIMEEIDHPFTYHGTRALLTKSAGVMVLVDGHKLQEGSLDQDHFTTKLLSYLRELDPHPRRGWPARPIAVVFTKADQCDNCFDDPSLFAERYASRLWQQCQQRFTSHRFFAAGVAGACAPRTQYDGTRVNVPLRIEPRGITEPFAWLVEQMKIG